MDNFRLGQIAVIVAVGDVIVTERGTPENEEAMATLVQELENCLEEGTLVNVCKSISTMAVGKMSLENEFFRGKKREITLRDVRFIHAGLKKLGKKLEGPDKENPSPELIEVRRARARVNYVVPLVFAVIYGGEFQYSVKIPRRNEVPEFQERVKRFLGIPADRLPKKEDGRTDFRIDPENMRSLRQTLVSLAAEEKDEEKNLDGLSIREKILQVRGSRNGEAEFFWDHLTKGLKEEPRAPRVDESSGSVN